VEDRKNQAITLLKILINFHHFTLFVCKPWQKKPFKYLNLLPSSWVRGGEERGREEN
jgi:hypothetical protein